MRYTFYCKKKREFIELDVSHKIKIDFTGKIHYVIRSVNFNNYRLIAFIKKEDWEDLLVEEKIYR